jgi:7-carboxy-7-deazaguanine synthase
MTQQLRISEIFRSIQGETSYAGMPCVFVRTAGCNLHCRWCDTAYARVEEGTTRAVPEIAEDVQSLGPGLVCITGGEPLLQAEAVCALTEELLSAGRTVLIETNGTQDLSPLPAGAVVIMDVKCPGSGESGKTFPANIARLRPRDEVKFVIADRADFDWSTGFVMRYDLLHGPTVLFAPVSGSVSGAELAEWILESGLNVRLQLQLHKILWPDRDRGV